MQKEKARWGLSFDRLAGSSPLAAMTAAAAVMPF
jgi:hypothetical protein